MRGDASVDAGNAFCKDDIRRARRMTFLAIDDSDKDVIEPGPSKKILPTSFSARCLTGLVDTFEKAKR